MDLFVLRHGKAGRAVAGGDDASRDLTREGRADIRKVARWMRGRGYRFGVIATSPLQRSVSTAAIVASTLDMDDRLEVWDELAPGGDPDTVCYRASQPVPDPRVLITGHEPGLSLLISRVICSEGRASVLLGKGGLAKIRNFSFSERPGGELQWLLTPSQIRSIC